MDERKLLDKLQRIEALFAGAATPGERVAAGNARDRIRARIKEVQEHDPPIEYRFSMGDMWSRKLFVALLRRYGIKPYRYYRQRHTTVMARVSKSFVDETLWPGFQELDATLRSFLEETTSRVIKQAIHSDSSEAAVTKQLPETGDTQ